MNSLSFQEVRPVDYSPHRADYSGSTDRMKSQGIAASIAITRSSEGLHPVRAELMEPFDGPAAHDANYVIVRHMPYGNDVTHPKQRLQTRHLAEAINLPVIAIGAPSKTSTYKLTSSEVASQYLDQACEAMDTLQVPLGKVAFMGWSQGATMGLAHARRATKEHDVVWAAAGDPTNVMERGKSALLRDFSKAGFGELYDTIASTGLEDMTLEAYGVRTGVQFTYSQRRKAMVRQGNASFLKETASGFLPKLKLLKVLGSASLHQDLEPLLQSSAVVLARAEKSPMSPEAALLHEAELAGTAQGSTRLKLLKYLETDHTHGDHLEGMAHFARQAVKLAAQA